MDIATNFAGSSIMARIAKIQERMHIEVASGVQACDKEQFASVCEIYEQQGAIFLINATKIDVSEKYQLEQSSIQVKHNKWKVEQDWENFEQWLKDED